MFKSHDTSGASLVIGLLFITTAGASALQQSPSGPPPALPAPSQDQRPPISDPVNTDVSPARQIKRDKRGRSRQKQSGQETGIRSIDGTGNNRQNTEIGAAFIPLMRLTAADYGDGISSLAGQDRPSARVISNGVSAQDGLIANPQGLTDYFWQWGQFLDHDIDLTDGVDPAEPAPIAVPAGDPFFDPFQTGTEEISLNRSLYDPSSGVSVNRPREQENEITSWIDASNVYGSDSERAAALRTLDGTGLLKTSARNLLPFNTNGLANAGGDSPTLFLAGDVRANEQAGLTAMHTLFVREHNRLATEIRDRNPGLTGDEIYEQARRLVGAQMQVITYREFLPLLLGQEALPPYRGYDPNIDAGIANSFSTAAYRFGHSALSPFIQRLDRDGSPVEEGPLALRDAFFNTSAVSGPDTIDPILRGLAAQICQRIDPLVIDDIRNFLFGPPGAGGFDLASLNIQRGRDHGLPSYNAMREALGMRPARRFSDISTNPEFVARLRETYDLVDQVDLWVGGLAEDPVRGGQVGALFHKILRDQFLALRDGDRFWYERTLSDDQIRRVEATSLADIIRRNSGIGRELPDTVFQKSPLAAETGRLPPTGSRQGGRR